MIQVRVLGRERRLFYGWIIVVAGALNQTINAGLGLHGFGTFLVPLEQQFGWSKATLSGARSLVQAESGFLGPLGGFLFDRFGARVTMAVGVAIAGLGFVLLSRVDSLWMYYLAFTVVALGNGLGGGVAVSATINNWFRRNRTMALSLASSGVGLGAIIIVPLLVWGQGTFGWRGAAFGAGLAVWALGFPIAALMRHSPERYGTVPDGYPTALGRSDAVSRPRQEARGGGLIDFTLAEAMRTRAFWILGIGHGMGAMPIMAVTVHQFAHMEQGVGLSRASAAAVVTVIGVLVIVGRLVCGVVGDRVDKRHLCTVSIAGTAGAMLLLATAHSLAQTMAYGVIFGFFWGVRGPLIDAIRGEYFGRKSFARIVGTSSLLVMPGSIFGPIFAGYMADVQGNYVWALIILAVASGLGGSLFLIMKPPVHPGHRRA